MHFEKKGTEKEEKKKKEKDENREENYHRNKDLSFLLLDTNKKLLKC